MLGRDKVLNVYTDSRYTFATAHIHGAIYRERGLLTAEGKTIKNKDEILTLLAALWLPKRLAIIHCPGHQKTNDPVSRGNALADRTAREIAQSEVVLAAALPDPGDPSLPDSPTYSPEDLAWIAKQPTSKEYHGWWRMGDGKVILPEKLGEQLLFQVHRTTHMGTQKMQDLIRWADIKIKDAHPKTEQIVARCRACQMTNANSSPAQPGMRLRGVKPGAYRETDFTEIKKGSFGYKYLLVFIDTFSG